MYDNPDVVPEYPSGSVEPTGEDVVPSEWYTETRFGGRTQWQSCPIMSPKDRHPDTGEELDLIN